MKSNKIFIVDDDKTTIDLMQELLESEGYLVNSALSGEKAIKKLKYSKYDILITDLKMPGISGIDLLDYCLENYPEMPVIILTAHGTIESAVNALKRGAFDYLTKPIQIDELIIIIAKAISHQNLKMQNIFLKGELSKHEDYFIDSKNEEIIKLLDMIDSIKDLPSTILIYGETGTGKEVLARLIHKKSQRSQESFVPINCGAIPESLLESELFGYAKGAFTDAKSNKKGKLEIANGGTLFLDEIEELSPKAQVTFLRFLQNKEITPLGSHQRIKVDVRIITATNVDLKSLIKQNKFREDLFYRINVFPIILPPLRKRKEDIVPLAYWFLTKFIKEYPRQPITGFTNSAEKLLVEYSWPGNIRELKNYIERAVIIEKGKKIDRDSLLIPSDNYNKEINFDKIGLIPLKELKDSYIKWVLEKCDGNKSLVAAKLGISIRGLRNILNK